MTKFITVFSLLFFAGLHSIAQKKNARYDLQKFSPDTVKSVIDEWTKELSVKHPGFYRYNSKAQFTHYIDSVKSTIHDSLTGLQSFLKLKPIISNIHCLHTGLSLPKEYGSYLNELPNLFPFQLYFEGNEAYVIKNFSSTDSIAGGDEIKSINGQSIEEIIARLFTLIPADGYNTTMKYRALYFQFPSWYRLIDPAEEFTVVVKQKDSEATYRVKGAKYNDIVQDGFLREPARAKQLAFKIENNIATLTIHTFSNSAIKKAGQSFTSFIDDAFARVRKYHVHNLVVDVRDNTGGSDANAVYLTSYFFDKPFRYWNRIEVTKAVAGEIKGPALKMFYRKPLQQDSLWLWQKARHVRDFDFYEEQQPARNNFKGNTYLLINGFCMSSCADAAAVLSYNKKVVCVGQETGGGYQGNNSGLIPESKVSPFDFTITVPLQKYVNFVDLSNNAGRGTKPDYAVSATVQNVMERKDLEIEMAETLIKKGLKQ